MCREEKLRKLFTDYQITINENDRISLMCIYNSRSTFEFHRSLTDDNKWEVQNIRISRLYDKKFTDNLFKMIKYLNHHEHKEK